MTYHDSRCVHQVGSRVAPKLALICTAPSQHRRYIANSSTRYHSTCFLGGESQYIKLTQTSWQPVITFLRSVLYLLSLHALHTVLTTQPDCSVGWDCCNTSDGASSRLPPLPFCVSSHRTYEHSRTLPNSKRADYSRHLNCKLRFFYIYIFFLCFFYSFIVIIYNTLISFFSLDVHIIWIMISWY